MFVCSKFSGGCLRHLCKVSSLPNLELTQAGKVASIAQKHCKVRNNPQPAGAKDYNGDTTDCPEVGKKTWGELF